MVGQQTFQWNPILFPDPDIFAIAINPLISVVVTRVPLPSAFKVISLVVSQLTNAKA
jgi:hypothetical protein